jgi:putative oxidoreductase
MQNVAVLIGRFLMAYIFVFAGYHKAMATGPTQHFMEQLGLPGALVYLVILLEIGGGLALVLGAYTRLVAALLAGFCLFTGFLVHFHPGDDGNMLHFYKNACMAGGFLVLYAHGAGAFSLDQKLKLKWS